MQESPVAGVVNLPVTVFNDAAFRVSHRVQPRGLLLQ